MIQQALDFQAESDALFALLDPLTDQDWERKSQFKEWTINDVIAHLRSLARPVPPLLAPMMRLPVRVTLPMPWRR